MSSTRRILSKLGIGQDPEKKQKKRLINDIADTFSIFLCDLLGYLETQREESHLFDPRLFEGLGVTLETYGPNDQNLCADPHQHPFFSPMELETLEEFLDMSDPASEGFVKYHVGIWFVPRYQIFREVNHHNASSLCRSLDAAFSDLPYKRGEDKTSFELCDFKNWKEIDEDEAFQVRSDCDGKVCWSYKWRSQPEHVWAAKDKPHMMACMGNGYVHDDASLYVSEIEAIVALMIVRLNNESFPDHNIVPVMLFSFTGDKRGRILQAYMNDKSLVIRKSRFYDWSPRQDAHLDLFLQYMRANCKDRPKSSIVQRLGRDCLRSPTRLIT